MSISRSYIAALLLLGLLNSIFESQADEQPGTFSPIVQQGKTVGVDDIDCLAEWLVEKVLARPDHNADDEYDVDVDNDFRVTKRRGAKLKLVAILMAHFPTIGPVDRPVQRVWANVPTPVATLASHCYLYLLHPF
jgi:hypothetical protein